MNERHKLYFEDLKPGDIFDIGSRKISREEIISFAEEYDPQPFHMSEEAAEKNFFGGLIASGWHTCAVFMRLKVDNFLTRTVSYGSPGVDGLRWFKPVYAGNTLKGRISILETRLSKKHDKFGIVKFKNEMINQDDETVMIMEGVVFIGRKGG